MIGRGFCFGIKRERDLKQVSLIMAHYQKTYYALNKTNSKNIMISLLQNSDDTFTPVLDIYSDKDGCQMNLRQYLDLYNASTEIFEFLDGKCKPPFINLSNDNTQLFISGQVSACKTVMFKQTHNDYTSVVCIAKNTFEMLLKLRPLIQRYLIRFEQSMGDIADTYKKVKAGDNNIKDKINMHGFDVTNFALELKLYANGVTDAVFNCKM